VVDVAEAVDVFCGERKMLLFDTVVFEIIDRLEESPDKEDFGDISEKLDELCNFASLSNEVVKLLGKANTFEGVNGPGDGKVTFF